MDEQKEELRRWIEEDLPNDGEWYHSDGIDMFVGTACTMLAYGMSVTLIKSNLQGLYTAVAEEFGD
jgi:hypothetical protein